MMDMRKYLIPGVLLGETHYNQAATQAVMADAVGRIASLGRYEAVEIPFIPWAEDRMRIHSTAQSHGLAVVQWVGGALEKENCNLSSIDQELRRKSASRLMECMELAAECGASTIGVLSGPDPGPDKREAAIESLAESLLEAAVVGSRLGVSILLEPLDLEMHKKGLVGKSAETSLLRRRLGANAFGIKISLDTAHTLLNGEDPMSLARE